MLKRLSNFEWARIAIQAKNKEVPLVDMCAGNFRLPKRLISDPKNQETI